ncbi:protein S100-B-like isoform X2 [Echeneis naucrates]|uniref:protein S100-B-like isoform X2 n=1 Tax=Echeneis naucrates TaxID=173247 RepID=UPI00111398EE|nr:protein S100-B-like isoform X2 [Echeneis naucrates]
MTELEKCMESLIVIFHHYAGKDRKKHKLNKDELKIMLEKEIQSPELKGKINADDIEEAMEALDKNHDGEVNLREFCRCVCDLAKCYYHKKTGKGGKKGKGKEKVEEL